ncbi:MAG: RodZ domain-containing protein [Acidobacteriota bacterium]
MDLREIGTILREERERQGLSLDTVSDKIKVSRSCLAAIEDGNEKTLPHPVYAKGFIKNYAKLLGFDQAEFTAWLSTVYQTEETHFREISLITDIPEDDCGCSVPTPAPRPPFKAIALVGIGLLLAIGLGWFVVNHFFLRPEGETPAAPTASSGDVTVADSKKTALPAAPEPEAPAPVTPAPVPPAPAPVASTPAPAPVAVIPTVPVQSPPPVEPAKPAQDALPRGGLTPEDRATQDIAVSGPAAAVPAVPPAPEAAPAPAAPTAKSFTVGDSGPHTVVIAANERCWLQAGADGGSMHESMLEKGDTFTGHFTDYLLVRLGNAGAVEIHFDNKLYPLQVGKGAVKTLKFVAKKTEGEAAKPVAGATAAPTPPPAPAAPASATTAPAVPVAPAAAEATPGGKEVEIYGQDGSWVIVSPDKGPAKEIYVKKGQRISVPFGEKIEIKLGNPSNVVFRYDGKETPVSTEKGGVKTIRFP